MPTLRYFFEAVQDRAEGTNGLTRGHRFRTVARMEIALYVTEGLNIELAVREQVPLLDMPIIKALLCLDQTLIQSLRLTPIVGKIIVRQ